MARPPHTRYRKARNLVWRLAPDRVLVKRTDRTDEGGGTTDLMGSAALVWIACDPPSTCDDIATMTGLDEQAVGEALDVLLENAWLVPEEQ